jgi:hypothetical protein
MSSFRYIYKSGIELAAFVSGLLIQHVRKQNCGKNQGRIGCSWECRMSNNSVAAHQHQRRFPMHMSTLRHLTKPHTERTIITNAGGVRNTTDPIVRSVPFLGCSQVARSRYSRLLGNLLSSATSVCGREFHWTHGTNHCGAIYHWL